MLVSEAVTEQLFEVQDLNAVPSQDLDEMIVLFLGSLQPEEIIEQQGLLVVRRDPADLDPGAMHHHRPQGRHFRANIRRRHGCSSLWYSPTGRPSV